MLQALIFNLKHCSWVPQRILIDCSRLVFATLLFSPTLQHLYIFYTLIHAKDSICCAADLHMYECSLLLASAWQSRQSALLCYTHALNHAHTMILTLTHIHFTCTVCSKYIRIWHCCFGFGVRECLNSEVLLSTMCVCRYRLHRQGAGRVWQCDPPERSHGCSEPNIPCWCLLTPLEAWSMLAKTALKCVSSG